MASVDLKSIQLYEVPTKVILPQERVRQALNASDPTVVGKGKPTKTPGPSDEWSEKFRNHDLIQILDITGSPGREPQSPFRDPVVDPKRVEADAGGTFQHQLFVNGDLTTPYSPKGISNPRPGSQRERRTRLIPKL